MSSLFFKDLQNIFIVILIGNALFKFKCTYNLPFITKYIIFYTYPFVRYVKKMRRKMRENRIIKSSLHFFVKT